jgi:hypothetical protein
VDAFRIGVQSMDQVAVVRPQGDAPLSVAAAQVDDQASRDSCRLENLGGGIGGPQRNRGQRGQAEDEKGDKAPHGYLLEDGWITRYLLPLSFFFFFFESFFFRFFFFPPSSSQRCVHFP